MSPNSTPNLVLPAIAAGAIASTNIEPTEPITLPNVGAPWGDFLKSLRPKPPRPDQIDWSRFRNQRKTRKNKRRLFAAGGRVDFKK